MGPLIVGVLLLAAIAVLPQMWVRGTLKKHGADRPDLGGTGAEFARHVLDGMKLNHVKVEETDLGDHYDPDEKAVRLSRDHYGGRSVAAIAVAAHEVGHAMQDATDYGPFRTRKAIARQAVWVQRIGSVVILAAPLMAAILRAPGGLILELIGGLAILSVGVLMHLATLPVEFDASYKRALPLLEAGKFLPDEDMPAARSILRAAAYTYVAAAMMTLVNIFYWLRVLRL
ncbi:MAG: zinc metallopeptidase [Hyphomicrobiales bacterium]|nr:zinc metallopeptidase [Hyphomicrobiales bacterium]